MFYIADFFKFLNEKLLFYACSKTIEEFFSNNASDQSSLAKPSGRNWKRTHAKFWLSWKRRFWPIRTVPQITPIDTIAWTSFFFGRWCVKSLNLAIYSGDGRLPTNWCWHWSEQLYAIIYRQESNGLKLSDSKLSITNIPNIMVIYM